MQLNTINRELEVFQKVEPQKQFLTEQLKQSQTEVTIFVFLPHLISQLLHTVVTGA